MRAAIGIIRAIDKDVFDLGFGDVNNYINERAQEISPYDHEVREKLREYKSLFESLNGKPYDPNVAVNLAIDIVKFIQQYQLPRIG